MLSKNAIYLLRQRYCRQNESPKDVFKRVASALSLGDEKFEKKLYKAMLQGYFLPNSPCIRNAGTKKGMLHACFCLPIQDDINSIFDTVKNMAVIFHFGGGVGINFSPLRPKNAPLSTGGTSSGVVSFMNIFDSVTETVKQGGFRRGALMGILNYNHPEIIEFIRSKLKERLTNFNISVMVTDEFMKKIESNEKIDLIFNNEKWNSIGAKDLFDLICFSAWNTGDPGLLFFDRINQDNPLYPKVKIDTTNPCLTGDTKIDTPYGQIPIKDLVGKEIPVYCYDGERINISWMRNVRKTRKKAEVWKVILDNGKSFKATPDHLVMLRDGTYKVIKDLKVGDSLMPFYRYKRNSKGYYQISLNNGKSMGEAHLVAEWKYGRKIKKGEVVHHINRIKTDNRPENLEIVDYGKHSSEHLKGDNNPLRKYKWLREYYRNLYKVKFIGEGNPRWDKSLSIEKVVKVYQKIGTIKGTAKKLNTTPKKVRKRLELAGLLNHKVVKVEFYGYEDVYDGEVEKYHNFALEAGVIVHNCSEVALPHYGACCLGSINISKFVKNNHFDFKKFSEYVKLGTRALLNMNQISWYPLPQITKVMKELNPIGLGIMGFADTLIMLGIYYDSEEALKFIDEVSKPYIEITNKIAKNSFYKRIIAPTGSLSILADCSSGIEPVFERYFQRHLTIGTITETREIYKSKYCKTAMEISPEWHLKIQAKWQEKLDGGLSKTINLPNSATVEDVKKIYKMAWQLRCKGITVFREGCKEGVLRKVSKCEGDKCYL